MLVQEWFFIHINKDIHSFQPGSSSQIGRSFTPLTLDPCKCWGQALFVYHMFHIAKALTVVKKESSLEIFLNIKHILKSQFHCLMN